MYDSRARRYLGVWGTCALGLNFLTCPLTCDAMDGQNLQIRPEFPPALRLTHIAEGYALVAWTVLPDGRLDDAVVLEASHAAFGQYALAAIPTQQPADPSGQLPRYEVLRISLAVAKFHQ